MVFEVDRWGSLLISHINCVFLNLDSCFWLENCHPFVLNIALDSRSQVSCVYFEGVFTVLIVSDCLQMGIHEFFVCLMICI